MANNVQGQPVGAIDFRSILDYVKSADWAGLMSFLQSLTPALQERLSLKGAGPAGCGADECLCHCKEIYTLISALAACGEKCCCRADGQPAP